MLRLKPNDKDTSVLAQLLTLEKKLFKKQDNWGGSIYPKTHLFSCKWLQPPPARAVAVTPPPSLHAPLHAPLADLLIKETQRRNTFLLYVEAPSTEATAAADCTRGSQQQQPLAPPVGNCPAPPRAKHPKGCPPKQQHQDRSQRQQPAAAAPAPAVVVAYIIVTTTGLNAHISKLAVAVEWRRRGIARQLVREAVATAARERRVSSLSLHVDSGNEAALALYRGEGFASEALLEVRGVVRGGGVGGGGERGRLAGRLFLSTCPAWILMA